MTTTEYFKIGAEIPRGEPEFVMSRTELATFYKCPDAWYRGRRFNGNTSTEWGSLVDTLLLVPKEFTDLYWREPEKYINSKKQKVDWTYRSKTCRAERDKQEKLGKKAVSSKDERQARIAIEAIKKDRYAGPIIDAALKQTVCRWEYKDKPTGLVIPMKCMIDLDVREHPQVNRLIGDLKTGRDGSEHGFKRSCQSLRYDLQVALYSWGYRECYSDPDNWCFVVSENDYPYPVSTYFLTPTRDCKSGVDGIANYYGRPLAGYKEMLRHYCHCLKTQHWPSYTPEPTRLRIFDND